LAGFAAGDAEPGFEEIGLGNGLPLPVAFRCFAAASGFDCAALD
jgi:hypothetical protein